VWHKVVSLESTVERNIGSYAYDKMEKRAQNPKSGKQEKSEKSEKTKKCELGAIK